MGIFQDHITLGTLVTCLTIVGSAVSILQKLTPLVRAHERNERWLETLWEEYNQRNGGGWRIAPGNPSERLHVYQPAERAKS